MLHADMIMALDIPGTETLYSEDDGVLLFNADCSTYWMSAGSEEAASKMADSLDMTGNDLCLHQMRYAGKVLEKTGKLEMIPCWMYTYMKKDVPAISNIPGIVIKKLNATYFGFIHDNYEHPEDEAIRWALANGMIGAFDKDKCVGFMGTRADGEMGLLKVLPEYRGIGIAKALESRVIAGRIKNGQYAYSNVVIGNTASIKLQESLGLEKADSMMVWLFTK